MIAELQHMPLSEAFLCLDCASIGNCSSARAACGSVQVHPIAAWLNHRKPVSTGDGVVAEDSYAQS